MSHGHAQAALLCREQTTLNGKRLAIATLNVPAALNTLSVEMVRALAQYLKRWEADPQIACVILESSGDRAFCAGADVRALRQAIITYSGPLPNPTAQAFFSDEYRLDYHIHHYRKPILVWGNGVVMGGGVGLMVGASHRVVTEQSRVAMPEVSIGLFPDVGGSWFLRRVPGRAGLFLALTGAALNGRDALAAGLADHCLRSTDYEAIKQQLHRLNWSHEASANAVTLSTLLAGFADHAGGAILPSNLAAHAALIESVADATEVAEAFEIITGYRGDDPWLVRAATALAGGSPSSVLLIWELWHRAATLDLSDVLRMELIVALHCCEHPDFVEGVRALLVDKDNAPQWSARAPSADPKPIADYFTAPWASWGQQGHPLVDL